MEYIIIGNIFGIIGLIYSAVAYHKKEKKDILKLLIISNSLSLIQYMFLQAYTGYITIIISIIRNIIASIIYIIGIWNGNENIIRKTGLINISTHIE